MLHWFEKRGTREEYMCTTCGGAIPKGTKCFKSTRNGSKYHKECAPKNEKIFGPEKVWFSQEFLTERGESESQTETPIEPQVSEVQVTETSTELTETSETPSSVEEVPLLRNRLGQFVKKS